MADALVNRALGVVEMDTTNDTFISSPVAEVENIIFACTAAGTFTIVIDGTTFTITTVAGQLTYTMPFNRGILSAVVSAIATGGKVFLMLRKKSSG